jgi:hypothetical protein
MMIESLVDVETLWIGGTVAYFKLPNKVLFCATYPSPGSPPGSKTVIESSALLSRFGMMTTPSEMERTNNLLELYRQIANLYRPILVESKVFVQASLR